MQKNWLLAGIAMCALSGCADGGGADDTPDEGEDDVEAFTWSGPTPHLVLKGTAGGEALDLTADATTMFSNVGYLNVAAAAEAEDPSLVQLTRVSAVFDPITVNGEERKLTINFEGHDPRGDAAGTELSIAAEPDADGLAASGFVALELAWSEPGTRDIVDGLHAIAGSATVEQSLGEDGPGGFIPAREGSLGFVAEASFGPGETVNVSVTVPYLSNAGTGEASGPPS